MTESAEITTICSRLQRVLDEVCRAIEGLDATQLNWRPPAGDTNSAYILATHILGNAEAWVLGIACEIPIERDRAAEFRSGAPDATAIVAKARELGRRFEDALDEIRPAELEETRDPPASLWGAGTPHPVTVREAFFHVIEHANEHLGHIGMTRDWMRAAGS
jgi:hypothetical protein